MKRIIIFAFAISCILFCCREPKSGSSGNISNKDSLGKNMVKKIAINAHQTMCIAQKDNHAIDSNFSCIELLAKLIKTSSYDTALQKLNYSIRVDQMSKGVITIELTIRNEERNEDVALSWIEMNINKNELMDVTTDPDKPIKLKYDTNLFRKIETSCKWN